jgi:glycosyltransferase involved in cell wall biosynthesis
MSKPFFSVIIPAYNQQDYIGRTLASVFSQTFTDFEVLVVDDGSTDDTVGEVLKSGYPVRVLQQTNQGPGAARNHGISVASGAFVAFLDGDDLWFPWTLSCFHEGLVANPACEWIVGRCVQFQEDGEIEELLNRTVRGEVTADFNRLQSFYETSGNYFEIYTGEFAIKRDILLDAGGYNEKMMNLEDGDLYLRLGVKTGIVEISNPVVFAYRRRRGSTSGNLDYALTACNLVLQKEAAGAYPGGKEQALNRLRIITRYVRPVVLQAIQRGRPDAAWRLFQRSWQANLRVGRIKYLLGVPLLCLKKCILG